MADPPAHADEHHLELLAEELLRYGTLESWIVWRDEDVPPYLLVVSKQTPGLAETITCDTGSGGPVVYLWSWGQAIVGATLADKARAIAYVLSAKADRK